MIMEEKNKKKQKNRKSILPVLLFAFILVAGIGSAVLVDYLSNQAEADVEVESPMELKVSTGSGWTEDDTVDLGSTYGGNTVSFMLQETNKADVKIQSNLVVKVTNEQGIESCDEITSMYFEETSGAFSGDIVDSCSNQGSYLRFETGVMNRTADTTYEYDVDTTFAQNAKGNYSATIQHLV